MLNSDLDLFGLTIFPGVIQANGENNDRYWADEGKQFARPRKNRIQTTAGRQSAGKGKDNQPGFIGEPVESFFKVFTAAR